MNHRADTVSPPAALLREEARINAVSSGMLRRASRFLSPAGRRARLSILIYHRVLSKPDPLFPETVDRARFDAQLDWISRWFNVLPLSDAVRRLRDDTLPPAAASITFDDGYADNAENAMPLLRARGLHATFFISTGYLDGGRMWNDTIIDSVRSAPGNSLDLRDAGLAQYPVDTVERRRSAIDLILNALKYELDDQRLARANEIARLCNAPGPDGLMATTAQVRALYDGGMGIGAHTVMHPILARQPADRSRQEIVGSRDRLGEITGAPITLFAYPNGKPGVDYLPEHARMVAELGFEAAVSTAWGAARSGADLFQLPRFTPWDRTPARFGVRMLSNLLAR